MLTAFNVRRKYLTAERIQDYVIIHAYFRQIADSAAQINVLSLTRFFYSIAVRLRILPVKLPCEHGRRNRYFVTTYHASNVPSTVLLYVINYFLNVVWQCMLDSSMTEVHTVGIKK